MSTLLAAGGRQASHRTSNRTIRTLGPASDSPVADIEHPCYAVASLQLVAKLRVVDLLLERTVRSATPCSGSKQEVNVTTGTIKKVVADRGFGFITAEDEKEYFFHRGGLDSSLDFDRLIGGERVEFDVEASPKGPRAANVHAA